MKKLIHHFETTIRKHGGRMVEEAKSERKGFLSMVLPIESSIQAGDSLNGGAAISIEEEKITLFTFFLRRICNNGILAPAGIQESKFGMGEADRFAEELQTNLGRIQTDYLPEMNLALRASLSRPVSMSLVQLVAQRMGGSFQPHAVLRLLIEEIKIEMDRPINRRRLSQGMTQFDLISGISSMARDHSDSAARWRWMQMTHDLLMGDFPTDESPTFPPARKIFADTRRKFIAAN